MFGTEPESCDAQAAAVLAAMAELTMRSLEADWALRHCHISHLLRPPSAYAPAVMLLDASPRAWKLLYLSEAASAATGDCTFPNIGIQSEPEKADLILTNQPCTEHSHLCFWVCK